MKLLVYGAGVLGSYLAHELYQSNHDVTILARNKRYEEIKENGLVMWHVRQKVMTTDKIAVIDRLNPEDAYDIIFVVMQRSQMDSVLPILAQNTTSKTIVLMGNNGEADKTYEHFMDMCTVKKTLLFGFLNCGGSRKEGVVYNWHSDRCGIIVGGLNKQEFHPEPIQEAIAQTNLQLEVKPDMNAWLKYHSALIVPMCIAIKYEGGADGNYMKSKMLKLSIESVKENISMLQKAKFVIDSPHDMGLLKWPTGIIQLILALFIPTKTGKAIAIDHALAATDEIRMLTEELFTCAKENGSSLRYLKQINELLIIQK